jgi:curved DNA-binding protein CbpA
MSKKELKDYYAVLGVNPQDSSTEIQKVYRRLANRFHPDKNPGDEAAEKRFKEINEAYGTLKNQEKREKYDRLYRLDHKNRQRANSRDPQKPPQARPARQAEKGSRCGDSFKYKPRAQKARGTTSQEQSSNKPQFSQGAAQNGPPGGTPSPKMKTYAGARSRGSDAGPTFSAPKAQSGTTSRGWRSQASQSASQSQASTGSSAQSASKSGSTMGGSRYVGYSPPATAPIGNQHSKTTQRRKGSGLVWSILTGIGLVAASPFIGILIILAICAFPVVVVWVLFMCYQYPPLILAVVLIGFVIFSLINEYL